MGLLDGEIAELVGSNLVDAGLSLPVTLIKVTPTPRDPERPTLGTAPLTTSHECQGFVGQLATYLVKDTLIKGVTRIVKIYGSTLPLGVVPVPGDRVTIESVTSTIANDDGGKQAVGRDPAGAVYTCQCL